MKKTTTGGSVLRASNGSNGGASAGQVTVSNRLKVLYWDGSGLWICAKRLERGRFSWPSDGEQSTRVTLSQEELSLLLGGIDLTRTRRKNWYRKEVELSEKI